MRNSHIDLKSKKQYIFSKESLFYSEETIKELNKLAQSGKEITIKIPDDIKRQVSKKYFEQITKELTILAWLDNSYAVNLYSAEGNTHNVYSNELGGNPTKRALVDLPGLLRGTLTGNAILETDYLMKSLVHKPWVYFPKDTRDNTHKTKELIEKLFHDQSLRPSTNEKDLVKFRKLMEEYREVGLSFQYPEISDALLNTVELENENPHGIGHFLNTFPPKIYVDHNTGKIACDSKPLICGHINKDNSAGIHERYEKEIEKIMFSGEITHANQDLAGCRLVFMLFPIIRSLKEVGMKLNFRDTRPC